MTILRFLPTIVALSIASAALGDEQVDAHMEPLPEELLQDPIILPSCPGIRIIEWRATAGRASTAPSLPAAAVINDVCKIATRQFVPFLRSEHIDVPALTEPFQQSLCLMPADIRDHGRDYRSLNDVQFRFAARALQDEVHFVWGYTESRTIYLMNDVLISQNRPGSLFRIVFAHELWHAQSMFYGLHDRWGHAKDEELAKRFTTFLGLGG